MIRITKPPAPNVLTTKGKAKRDEHVAAYDAGAREFVFDSKIYAHKTVKQALRTAQHEKCFLCESKITHISHGDVEHFRPKAGYRQDSGESLHKPGYYWLAYEWDNLFLSCQLCNQVFKKNLFPLANPKARATSHKKRLKREEPLFINPSVDKPEELISFRHEIPYPLKGSPKAKTTIEGLGLKRPELNERRLEHYQLVKKLYELIQMGRPEPESSEAKDLLDRMSRDTAPYAAMTRAAIKVKFRHTT